MSKNIIFDYAGVITPTGSFLPFANQYYKELGIDRDDLYDILRVDWEKAKTNEITSEQYWKNVSLRIGWPVKLLKDRVLQTFPNDKEVLSAISNLSGQHTTILMSNQIEGWIEDVLQPEVINDYFKYSFNSYQTGLSKPDSQAFLSLMQKVGGEPGEFVFIDDQEKNTLAAAKLGIGTILFSSGTNLNEKLQSFGIYSDKMIKS